MNKKIWNTLLNFVTAGLGLAGLILILLSMLTEKDTLKWGMLCVAVGSILGMIRMVRNRSAS